MLKLVLHVLVLGALAIGIWQLVDGDIAVRADHTVPVNCDNFTYREDAQDHMDRHPGDPDGLDGNDNDGRACEHLPLRPTSTPNPNATATPRPSTSGGAGALGPPPDMCVFYLNCAGGVPANCAAYNCGNNSCNYTHCGNYCGGAAYCPPYDVSAPSRPDHLSLKVSKTSLACNEAVTVVARVTFGNGAGAPGHMVTFQATQGTAFTNLLTDSQGYVNSTYVAPSTPTSVTLTAFADGMAQTQTISVICSGPPLPPPLGITYVSPILPPSTGDAGLIGADDGSSAWLYAAGALLLASAPVATFAVVRQRD